MSVSEYAIEIEVVEAGPCVAHKVGEKFAYPDEVGSLCPWLLDSISGMVRVLEHAGTLPWTYAGTPYEKQIDPDGVTTEYVRCPDPTSAGIVVKITRTRLAEAG